MGLISLGPIGFNANEICRVELFRIRSVVTFIIRLFLLKSSIKSAPR